MILTWICKGDIDFAKLDEVAHYIPSGMNVWDNEQEAFDLEDLRCFDQLQKVNWLRRSLGTLGGGNHFLEVDVASDGTKYLVIHSGSRNLGKQVAELYQEMAAVVDDDGTVRFTLEDALVGTEFVLVRVNIESKHLPS